MGKEANQFMVAFLKVRIASDQLSLPYFVLAIDFRTCILKTLPLNGLRSASEHIYLLWVIEQTIPGTCECIKLFSRHSKGPAAIKRKP